MDDQDDFEELAPAGKAPLAPVMLGVMALRGGALRLTFSIEEHLAKAVGDVGWPRFSVSYSKGQRVFRIAGKVQGPFESYITVKGRRVVIRVPPPPGLEVRAWEKVDPRAELRDGILYVHMPAVLLKPDPVPQLPSPQAAARAAIPAPNFSSRR